VISGSICLAAAAAEGLLAGGDVRRALAEIRQPRWALPLFGWILIGLAYYSACFFVLWRLLGTGLEQTEVTAAFVLLAVIMAANAAFNWFFFRRRDFRTSFWFFVPYAVLVAALIVMLSRIDTPSAAVFVIYAAYLPYALAWSFRVWRLNLKLSDSC
jgi:tryptophan-rich sensory protein